MVDLRRCVERSTEPFEGEIDGVSTSDATSAPINHVLKEVTYPVGLGGLESRADPGPE